MDKTTPSFPGSLCPMPEAGSLRTAQPGARATHGPTSPDVHHGRCGPTLSVTVSMADSGGDLAQGLSPVVSAVGLPPHHCLVVKAAALTLVSFYSPNHRRGVGPSTSLPAPFLRAGRGRGAGWPTAGCRVRSLPPLSGLGPPCVDLEASATQPLPREPDSTACWRRAHQSVADKGRKLQLFLHILGFGDSRSEALPVPDFLTSAFAASCASRLRERYGDVSVEIFCSRLPSAFSTGNPSVRRLCPPPR